MLAKWHVCWRSRIFLPTLSKRAQIRRIYVSQTTAQCERASECVCELAREEELILIRRIYAEHKCVSMDEVERQSFRADRVKE